VENFDSVRRLARIKHREVRLAGVDVATAGALLEGARRITGLHCEPVDANDSLLQGGEAILVPSVQSIFYNGSVDPSIAAFYQAHEFAHHWLDDAAAGACSAGELDVHMPEERAQLGLQRVEGYGPRERRETQANVFAREFLLPTAEARRLFVEKKLGSAEIAVQVGVAETLVYQQLALALLMPDSPTAEQPKSTSRSVPDLDSSQRAAAESVAGPLLLEAGPGTGKTRTLIARIETLLKRGVDPTRILALTFSNKAAGEMRERVHASSPEAAAAIWAGTFHAFGLEILRKWGHLLGLPKDVRLVDPSDALLLLEAELPSLALNHYLRLSDPAIELQYILKAISRAKDEIISPSDYRAYATRMLSAAGSDEEAKLAAEKAIEVAIVYEAYEQILKREQVVDFSDLINRSIELLQAHPPAKEEVQERYQHVLVDEYQDVNRASAVFLKMIAGSGKGLWVVGDARQSIYRFRGASPANIRGFETDFPGGRRLALDTNYRSQQHVVQLFEAFASGMKASAGGLPAKWNASRGRQGGETHMAVACDLAAEAVGLAQEIERQRNRGIPYRDQAILCRSHTQLARFATLFEAQGIPVLYLGGLFERAEIRDLLSLISLASEPTRGGLLRVASFVEYQIPLPDVRAVLAFAKLAQSDTLSAIRRLSEIDGLTVAGLRGLARLAAHLEGVDSQTLPSFFISMYLFNRSQYLSPLLAESTVLNQQRRIAIYQLLQFMLEYDATTPSPKGDPKRQLLRRIRRLEVLGDERQLRQMPDAANGVDAVRMLTVHASKGLEFGAVYLPGLGNQIFPAPLQYNPCPPPIGMLPDVSVEGRDAEEECLFFVALSRARDVICLSRAERYSEARQMAPSSLLSKIEGCLPYSPSGPARWISAGPDMNEPPAVIALARPRGNHTVEDLDQYLRCPRQYLYQRILDLSGNREDTAYVSFHRCVYHVIRWISHRPDGTSVPAFAEAVSELERIWCERGPTDHPYNDLYWSAALDIVERAVVRGAKGRVSSSAAIWDVPRPDGSTIRLQPDHIEILQGTVIVRRFRTGRAPKTVTIDPIYALYHQGAALAHPGSRIQVETHFLTADEIVARDMKPKMLDDRLKKYDGAVTGIASGYFPPDPKDARDCPKCPQYFICAALPPTKSSNGTSEG
jgi:DNA helicase II / ATP-dependent DNA helicase PcrA